MKYSDLKVVIVGCGSIGKRHARNLVALDVKNIGYFDTETSSSAAIAREIGGEVHLSLGDALTSKPNVVFITNPSSMHIETAIACAEAETHIFIEKPLSNNFKDIDQLMKLVKQENLITMVGCNMRFHPGPNRVKEILEKGHLGRVLFARVYTGSYLPDWRPWQDYRKSYSAQKNLGGGCILDCIHEIDLIYWYMGEVSEVTAVTSHSGSLDIDVEDVAEIICQHNGGAISEIHLDYIQRTYERGCQMVGDSGSIFWDFNENRVRYYNASDKKWEMYQLSADWQMNQMYMDELKHFLSCVIEKRETICPIKEGLKALQIALGARVSASEGHKVNITKELI